MIFEAGCSYENAPVVFGWGFLLSDLRTGLVDHTARV